MRKRQVCFFSVFLLFMFCYTMGWTVVSSYKKKIVLFNFFFFFFYLFFFYKTCAAPRATYTWRNVDGVQREAYGQQQLGNQHFSGQTGTPTCGTLTPSRRCARRGCLQRSNSAGRRDSGYHDREITPYQTSYRQTRGQLCSAKEALWLFAQSKRTRKINVFLSDSLRLWLEPPDLEPMLHLEHLTYQDLTKV